MRTWVSWLQNLLKGICHNAFFGFYSRNVQKTNFLYIWYICQKASQSISVLPNLLLLFVVISGIPCLVTGCADEWVRKPLKALWTAMASGCGPAVAKNYRVTLAHMSCSCKNANQSFSYEMLRTKLPHKKCTVEIPIWCIENGFQIYNYIKCIENDPISAWIVSPLVKLKLHWDGWWSDDPIPRSPSCLSADAVVSQGGNDFATRGPAFRRKPRHLRGESMGHKPGISNRNVYQYEGNRRQTYGWMDGWLALLDQ